MYSVADRLSKLRHFLEGWYGMVGNSKCRRAGQLNGARCEMCLCPLKLVSHLFVGFSLVHCVYCFRFKHHA